MHSDDRYYLVKRLGLLGGVCLVALAVDCSQMVVVTAPLTRPLRTTCIKSALDSIAWTSVTRVTPDSSARQGTRGTIFWLGTGTPEAVEQYEYRDSTAALQAWVSRFPGPRYRKPEAESLSKVMGATLLRARNACGGVGVPGDFPYTVKRSP